MEDGLKQHKFEIYFTKESGLGILRVDYDKIISVELTDGFIRIHDRDTAAWHCYNLNFILHIHYPD